MTITRQRLNQILKEEVHRELQEQKLLQEKINVDKETYQKIMAKIIENANGSRKLYALTSNIDTVLVPWDSAISGRADDYYKIAQALTKGQRGKALRLDTMALIYGRIKNLDKETYLGVRINLLEGNPDSFFYKKGLEQLIKKKNKFEVACLAYLEAIRLE